VLHCAVCLTAEQHERAETIVGGYAVCGSHMVIADEMNMPDEDGVPLGLSTLETAIDQPCSGCGKKPGASIRRLGEDDGPLCVACY
jgi:hypothetical protein